MEPPIPKVLKPEVKSNEFIKNKNILVKSEVKSGKEAKTILTRRELRLTAVLGSQQGGVSGLTRLYMQRLICSDIMMGMAYLRDLDAIFGSRPHAVENSNSSPLTLTTLVHGSGACG